MIMKKYKTLFAAVLIFGLFVGCSEKNESLESELPTFESIKIEKLTDDSGFTHHVEYVYINPEEMDHYSNIGAFLKILNGTGEVERIFLPSLRDKAESNVHHEGRRSHFVNRYDLRGILEPGVTYSIEISAMGRNGLMKTISVPIEN
jgi:hypothetical protein